MEEPFQRIAAQLSQIEASKHRSMLVDPSELPARERKAPKMGELFWRQAASGKDVAPKKRRRQTLARQRTRRPKFPKRWGTSGSCVRDPMTALSSELT